MVEQGLDKVVWPGHGQIVFQADMQGLVQERPIADTIILSVLPIIAFIVLITYIICRLVDTAADKHCLCNIKAVLTTYAFTDWIIKWSSPRLARSPKIPSDSESPESPVAVFLTVVARPAAIAAENRYQRHVFRYMTPSLISPSIAGPVAPAIWSTFPTTKVAIH